MKALVYHGPSEIAWEEHLKPILRDSGDAIVRMLKTTICGTDLHILRGDVPTCTAGRVLGHEGVGVIELGAYDRFSRAAETGALKVIIET